MRGEEHMLRSTDEIVDIVATAGGTLIGRTRLQKTAFLLKLAGLGGDFAFEYRHYGPFSESLASTTDFACLFGDLTEIEQPSSWGGTYSIYKTDRASRAPKGSPREQLISIANKAKPIELELAATAAFLSVEGYTDPWKETADRKPDKIGAGRLDRAKQLYARIKAVETPAVLPNI